MSFLEDFNSFGQHKVLITGDLVAYKGVYPIRKGIESVVYFVVETFDVATEALF